MIDFQDYPIYSYPISVDTFSFNVKVGGNTYAQTFPAGNYYGYVSNDGTKLIDDTLYRSLHAELITQVINNIQDPVKHNIAGAVITGTYYIDPGVAPKIVAEFERQGWTAITELTFPDADTAKQFGFSTATYSLFPSIIIDTATTDINFAGYWYNKDLSVREQRFKTKDITSTESIYGTTMTSLEWSNSKQEFIVQHPVIWAAMIFEYRRSDPSFSDPYQLNVADPNNLLEEMFDNIPNKDVLWYLTDTRADLIRIWDPKFFKDVNNALEDLASGRLFSAVFDGRVKEESVSYVITTNIYS